MTSVFPGVIESEEVVTVSDADVPSSSPSFGVTVQIHTSAELVSFAETVLVVVVSVALVYATVSTVHENVYVTVSLSISVDSVSTEQTKSSAPAVGEEGEMEIVGAPGAVLLTVMDAVEEPVSVPSVAETSTDTTSPLLKLLDEKVVLVSD